jgi:uncharacterized protein (TIGR02246 family)
MGAELAGTLKISTKRGTDVAEGRLEETQAPTVQPQASAESALLRVGERLVASWNSHDIRSLAALFGEDATCVNTEGQWWSSRVQLESELVRRHQSLFRASRLTAVESKATLLSATVAALQIRWELVRLVAPNGSSLPHRAGTLLLILKKQDETWPIVMAQNTEAEKLAD